MFQFWLEIAQCAFEFCGRVLMNKHHWRFKWLFLVAWCLHCKQEYLIFIWTAFLWVFKCDCWVNCLSHSVHENFMPSWIDLVWRRRSPFVLVLNSQLLHLNVLLECTVSVVKWLVFLWNCKPRLLLYNFEQFEQEYVWFWWWCWVSIWNFK